ncbi:MAG: YncE family protein [Mycobacteriaceae bacterium]
MHYKGFQKNLKKKYASFLAFSLLATLISPGFAQAQDAGVIGPEGQLYIPEVANDTVAVMDTENNRMLNRIPIVAPLGPSRPAVLAKSPDGKKIYTDNFGALAPSISIIDRESGDVRTLRVESVPLGIFTSGDGKEIYIPEVGFVVEVLDIETDTIVRKLRFPDSPAGAMTGPDGLMYVGFVSGLIGAYDPQTGATVKPPIWSGGLANFWYSFTRDGKKLYTDSINSLGVIDMETWTLVKTVATVPSGVGGLMNPGAFTSEISPDGTKLYVTLFGGNGVMVFSTKDEELLGIIPTEGDVIGLTFSGDGSRGYIADCGPTSRNIPGPVGEMVTFFNLITVGLLGPGKIITFDPANDEILDTAPTAGGPGVPLWLPNL